MLSLFNQSEAVHTGVCASVTGALSYLQIRQNGTFLKDIFIDLFHLKFHLIEMDPNYCYYQAPCNELHICMF